MKRGKDSKLTTRMIGLVVALALSAVVHECSGAELELMLDPVSLDAGFAAAAPSSTSLITGCVIGLHGQPLPETLPGYGFATSAGGSGDVLCLVSLLTDASLVLARAVDRHYGRASSSLVEWWTSPYESTFAFMPALSTIDYDGSIIGLAIGLNARF